MGVFAITKFDSAKIWRAGTSQPRGNRIVISGNIGKNLGGEVVAQDVGYCPGAEGREN